MIVVTGATGHVGNVLVRKLAEQGENIRVVLFNGEGREVLDGLDVEVVTGDVCDADSLHVAFEGADKVFHIAGMVSIMPGKRKALEAVNVQGTQNVIDACKAQNVRRLIYCSSIHALEELDHGVTIDENTPVAPLKVTGNYAKSKARATLRVLEAAKNGLDAVVCKPTGVVGPFDYAPSRMGQMYINVARRKQKAYIDGAYDFVDVRDLADGFIAAAEKGRKGEIYILSGEQISVKKILDHIGEAAGVKPPSVKIPNWLAYVAAYFMLAYYKVTKNSQPTFVPYSIHTLNCNSDFSNEKARRELGYNPRSMKESVADAIQWFRKSGRL